MLQVSDAFKQAMVAPVRCFAARAEVRLNESNVSEVTIFTHEDAIKTIEIQRVGDNSKFFGFGICQRLNMHIVDLDNIRNPLADSDIKIKLGVKLPSGSVEFIGFPTFKVSERNREEEEGELSITAYDKLDKAGSITVADLGIEPPYTIRAFVQKCAEKLGVGCVFDNVSSTDAMFALSYADGANFDGTESVRFALDAAAEATQCVYYIDESDNLRFKRLVVSGASVATITDDDYFIFHHKENRRLTNISHVTELGDNVTTTNTTIGTTQYIRNNPFWDLREDIGTVVENALSNVNGMTISQFDCEWRGNLPLEIGDKIEIKQVKTSDCVQPAYVFDDVISFDGGYGQKTQWSYSQSNAETESNPSTLGDALNQTYAKVDKVNKQITLVASQADENSQQISAIQINTDSISQSVEEVQKNVEVQLDGVNTEIANLTERVETTMTKDEFTIEIQKITETPTQKVETTTGFTFDETGLTIDKTGSEMSTQITEDGMTVSKGGEVVLTANNEGVEALNLHATTYLIIGENSRFEDYTKNGQPRTGCFFIGGA